MSVECHDEVCITCSDQLLEFTVMHVDAAGELHAEPSAGRSPR